MDSYFKTDKRIDHVTLSSNDYIRTSSLVDPDTGEITNSSSSQTKSITYSMAGAKEAYISVPAKTVSGGFTLTLYGTSGTDMGFINRNTDITFENGKYYEMTSFDERVDEKLMVDLGLSVKWGTFNIGSSASIVYGGGDYYSWGATDYYYLDGYSRASTAAWKSGKSGGYSYLSYPFYQGGLYTKYFTDTEYSEDYDIWGTIDNKTILDDEDDAAHVILGNAWRMPTYEEWEELLDPNNCNWEYTTINSINGYKVTSKKSGHTSDWIFLPTLNGYRSGTGLTLGDYGYYWSSSLNEEKPWEARAIVMVDTGINKAASMRRCNYGLSIRPIYSNMTGVKGVKLDKYSIEMDKGESQTLAATIVPSDAADKSITWSSDNESVATVVNGTVTAVGYGSARITATAADGFHSASCDVLVPIPTVDLGLSVKWASFNLGANDQYEYGDYFAWGEIEPYYQNGYAQSSAPIWKSGKNNGYSYNSYIWYDATLDVLTKYSNDRKTTLYSEDDPAYHSFGLGWRTPKSSDWEELITNCTFTMVQNGGEMFYKAESKKNGNYIILPFAGYRYGKSIGNTTIEGCYWSSTIDSEEPDCSIYFRINGPTVGMRGIGVRYMGYSIRPVRWK